MLANIQSEVNEVDSVQGENNYSPSNMQFGFVQSIIDKKFSIEVNGGRFTALLAPSCLVSPKVNDYVALITDNKRSFVLAVLERGDGATTLDIECDAEIKVSAPSIQMFGKQQINFVGLDVNLTASDFSLSSENAKVTANTLATRIENLTHLGKTVKAVLADILVRAAMSLRVIDGPDHQRAEQVTITANKHLSLKGELTSIVAKSDVKVDAERVHLG